MLCNKLLIFSAIAVAALAQNHNWKILDDLYTDLDSSTRIAINSSLIAIRDVEITLKNKTADSLKELVEAADSEFFILVEKEKQLEKKAKAIPNAGLCLEGVVSALAKIRDDNSNLIVDCIGIEERNGLAAVSTFSVSVLSAFGSLTRIKQDLDNCKIGVTIHPDCYQVIQAQLILETISLPKTILDESLALLVVSNDWTDAIEKCSADNLGNIQIVGNRILVQAEKCIANVK